MVHYTINDRTALTFQYYVDFLRRVKGKTCKMAKVDGDLWEPLERKYVELVTL